MNDPRLRPDPNARLEERSWAFEGRMVRVSRDRFLLPSGKAVVHETIHLPSAVAVVPLLEEGEGPRRVVLVEQFRTSVGAYIHELPAGILEEGEDPEACARRELEEETGYRAGKWTHLASLLALPGTSAHRMHFFLAEELSGGEQRLEDGECLDVRRLPFDELVDGILRGAPGSTCVVDTKTQLGLLYAAFLRRREGRGGGPAAPPGGAP
jgi:ADP-ribose pyrophosphatase